MNKPENLEEVKGFIYEKLKEKYGENVVMENDSRSTIAVYTNTYVGGCNDVWISLEYFH